MGYDPYFGTEIWGTEHIVWRKTCQEKTVNIRWQDSLFTYLEGHYHEHDFKASKPQGHIFVHGNLNIMVWCCYKLLQKSTEAKKRVIMGYACTWLWCQIESLVDFFKFCCLVLEKSLKTNFNFSLVPLQFFPVRDTSAIWTKSLTLMMPYVNMLRHVTC